MAEFEPPEDDDELAGIRVPKEWEAGGYANASAVTFTPDEFTIDFIRLNPYRSGGVVVAGIVLSERRERSDAEPRAANPPPAKGRFAKAIAASRLATARKILKLDP